MPSGAFSMRKRRYIQRRNVVHVIKMWMQMIGPLQNLFYLYSFHKYIQIRSQLVYNHVLG
jgi:hypothetical protein